MVRVWVSGVEIASPVFPDQTSQAKDLYSFVFDMVKLRTLRLQIRFLYDYMVQYPHTF